MTARWLVNCFTVDRTKICVFFFCNTKNIICVIKIKFMKPIDILKAQFIQVKRGININAFKLLTRQPLGKKSTSAELQPDSTWRG